MKIHLTCFLILGLALISSRTYSQVFTNKEVGTKNQAIIDSLKNYDYPYVLPIWGEKATKAGFNLPYSAGFSLNYLWQESDIIINNLQVGFNGGQKVNLDEIVRFNNATSSTNAINFRPDFWLFPFLNIYGIFSTSQTTTAVDVGVVVPDLSGTEELFSIKTEADFQATTLGFGITPTMGVAGGWIALDMNFSWSDIPELQDPAYTFIFGPRFGKAFRLKNPESNINVWVGGFRVHINSGTDGSIPLNSILETDGLDETISNAQMRVSMKQEEVEEWWNSLSQVEKIQNAPKYARVTGALAVASEALDRLENAAENIDNSTVDYSLDKRQANLWNFIIGGQYQINKHWMVRGEFGFLGARTQALAGLQYRFGL